MLNILKGKISSMSNQSTLSTTMIIIAIIGLVIGGGGGYLIVNNLLQPRINELKTQNDEQNTEIQTLENTIDDFEAQVSELNMQHVEDEGMITNLETEKTYLQDQVSSLDNQIGSLEAEVSNFEEQVELKESIIDSHVNALSDRQRQIDTLKDESRSLKFRLGDRMSWEKYSANGVYFEYPPEMTFMDLMASEEMGMAIGMMDYNETDNTSPEAFSLFWGLPYENITLAVENMMLIYEYMEVEIDSAIYVNSTVNNHPLVWTYFEYSDVNGTYYVIIGAWNCDDSERGFMVIYAYDYSDVFLLFHRFIETIVCHSYEGLPEVK